MIQGVSKQVVLVRPRGEESFEQAIFILKESGQGVSEAELLRQAGSAMRERKRGSLLWKLLYLLLGAAGSSLVWFALSWL